MPRNCDTGHIRGHYERSRKTRVPCKHLTVGALRGRSWRRTRSLARDACEWDGENTCGELTEAEPDSTLVLAFSTTGWKLFRRKKGREGNMLSAWASGISVISGTNRRDRRWRMCATRLHETSKTEGAARKAWEQPFQRASERERLESRPSWRIAGSLTSCARGCWWSQWRCSNIPFTRFTAHITSRTASDDTPVVQQRRRGIFNRTRAAITDDTRARNAWHILSAPAGAAHLYTRRSRQRRAAHVRYLEERGGGGTLTSTTTTTTATATLSLG